MDMTSTTATKSTTTKPARSARSKANAIAAAAKATKAAATKVVPRPEAKPAKPAAAKKAPAKKAPAADPTPLAQINADSPAVVAGVAQLAAKTSATFVSADHTDGYTCRCCGETKPVNAFPTTKGPEVRATRCRTCRDAK